MMWKIYPTSIECGEQHKLQQNCLDIQSADHFRIGHNPRKGGKSRTSCCLFDASRLRKGKWITSPIGVQCVGVGDLQAGQKHIQILSRAWKTMETIHSYNRRMFAYVSTWIRVPHTWFPRLVTSSAAYTTNKEIWPLLWIAETQPLLATWWQNMLQSGCACSTQHVFAFQIQRRSLQTYTLPGTTHPFQKLYENDCMGTYKACTNGG